MGADAARARFVRSQLDDAAAALLRGDLRAARVALRALRSVDFTRPDLAETCFAVLRDMRSEEADLLVAAGRLVSLEPAT